MFIVVPEKTECQYRKHTCLIKTIYTASHHSLDTN